MMQAYGYEKNSDKLLKLKEATLSCSVEEIEKLIVFLKIVKQRHEYCYSEGNGCHTHYCDWDKEWDGSSSDFIIVTEAEKEE